MAGEQSVADEEVGQQRAGQPQAGSAPLISAVVITSDNEQTIAETVAALAWCDEVVVVDAGSTDRTAEICRRLGCRVLQRPFDGFGLQKQFAVSAAQHDWVLVVDSDEVVSAELAAEIRVRLANDGQRLSGYEIPISLVFLGRVLRHGGEFGKPHLRLFDRRQGNYNSAELHEHVVLQGPIGRLRGHVLHSSYRDMEHYFEKFNRYTSIAARVADERGSRARHWLIPWLFPIKFCQLYLGRGLILDGYPGFVWALFSALYATVKRIKLAERQDRHTDRK